MVFTDAVPEELITPDPKLDLAQNAGPIHNAYLKQIFGLVQQVGWNASASKACDALVSYATALEDDNIIPKGSVDIFNDFVSQLLASQTFEDGITICDSFFNQVKSDQKYTGTATVAALSVASFTSKFWHDVTVQPNPTDPPSPYKIPKWLLMIAIDAAGALAGAAAGSTLPGVGTIVGGIVGGAGASAAEAN